MRGQHLHSTHGNRICSDLLVEWADNTSQDVTRSVCEWGMLHGTHDYSIHHMHKHGFILYWRWIWKRWSEVAEAVPAAHKWFSLSPEAQTWWGCLLGFKANMWYLKASRALEVYVHKNIKNVNPRFIFRSNTNNSPVNKRERPGEDDNARSREVVSVPDQTWNKLNHHMCGVEGNRAASAD